jgi:hypothetical protein
VSDLHELRSYVEAEIAECDKTIGSNASAGWMVEDARDERRELRRKLEAIEAVEQIARQMEASKHRRRIPGAPVTKSPPQEGA